MAYRVEAWLTDDTTDEKPWLRDPDAPLPKRWTPLTFKMRGGKQVHFRDLDQAIHEAKLIHEVQPLMDLQIVTDTGTVVHSTRPVDVYTETDA